MHRGKPGSPAAALFTQVGIPDFLRHKYMVTTATARRAGLPTLSRLTSLVFHRAAKRVRTPCRNVILMNELLHCRSHAWRQLIHDDGNETFAFRQDVISAFPIGLSTFLHPWRTRNPAGEGTVWRRARSLADQRHQLGGRGRAVFTLSCDARVRRARSPRLPGG